MNYKNINKFEFKLAALHKVSLIFALFCHKSQGFLMTNVVI